jgi:integrase
MRIRLTQIAVDRIAPPKTGRLVAWDTVLPAFGVRVSPSGTKSWFVHYRVGGGRKGKRVFETLGTLAQIPDVADARQAARDSLTKAEAGDNPVVEKRAVAAAAITVNDAVARYLAECDRNLKPNTAREWRRIYEHDVLPRWGDRPIAEIAKGDVLELVHDKAARRERKRQGSADGAAVQAGKMLTRLRTFFRWSVANDLTAADPTAGVRRPAKEASRDRFLTDDEIRAFWGSAEQHAMPWGHLFRLMLLTAQRENEVAGMRWPELDIEKRTWAIPGQRSKNGKSHTVHLSALAIEILEQVPRGAGQDLLFSGTGTTPVSGFSRAKARIDRLMGGDIAHWVLHDLRRTATTGMARLGIAPHVADKVLNHQAGTIRGVAAVYNRFEYLDERKAALGAWGRFVESLVRPVQSNVVPLVAAG